MYQFSVVIAICSGFLYHMIQKSISHRADPLISLMITYATALSLTLVMYLLERRSLFILSELKHLNWASYALGIAIVGMEIGFLLAYRSGWNISSLSLISNLVVALILLPVGLIFFREILSLRSILGIAFSVLGLVLIADPII